MDMELITNLGIYRSVSLVRARFVEMSRRAGCDWVLERGWPFTDSVDPESILEGAGWVVRAAYNQPEDGRSVVLAEDEDTFAFVDLGLGSIDVEVAAGTSAATEKVILRLLDLFPRNAGEAGIAEVTFSSWDGTDISRFPRDIQVPDWQGISLNYGADVRRGVEALLTHEFDENSGKLALWYGPPGTGKTYAVRSLLNEWREDIDCYYVMDPERFFGSSVSYLLSMVLDDESTSKWRLIVIEDAAEMLSVDAREKVGNALGRLLNLCDGLIGQGLDLLVLITTNEDIGRLHPAVTRPGRCVSRVEFGPLDADGVEEWLIARGADPGGVPRRAMTLAEMFSVARGGAPEKTPKVGF